MKLSDYIAQFLADRGVTHAFGMSGGAAVHMFNSIDLHPQMEVVSMTHEQCAALAADGYSRASGRIGVAVTTSGPGATNLLTGTCTSFYDSIPTLMLTGQVATHRLKGDRKIRQMGFQETDVVSIFSSVTKYAEQIRDPLKIRYHLEKAYHIALEGRPGPVLLDIPDDLQREEIDPVKLEGYTPAESEKEDSPVLSGEISDLLDKLKQSKRPVVVLGGGLKTPEVGPVLLECIDRLGIPVLVSWAGLDLIPGEHPLRVGTFGVYGPRVGNYAVQNADLILTLGTRLSQNLTGGILPSFAREAKIVMVDADRHEMDKFDGRGIQIQGRINARLADFLAELHTSLKSWESPRWADWRSKIESWKNKFRPDRSPVSAVDHHYVDACEFVQHLSEELGEGDLVYVDTGGNLTWTCNNLKPKAHQRVFSSWNNTPMGYALPAAIGGNFHDRSRSVTCIIGDGGLMLCLGELATVVRQKLPLKVVLFNNHSHGIQKQTLETWLGGRKVAVDEESGLAFPSDFAKVAEAMGMKSYTIDGSKPMTAELREVYSQPGPVFVNVEINPDQKLYPVLKFGAALEDQLPALPEETIKEEMIIPPFENDGQTPIVRRQASQGW